MNEPTLQPEQDRIADPVPTSAATFCSTALQAYDPFYRVGGARVYHGDGMEVMRCLVDAVTNAGGGCELSSTARNGARFANVIDGTEATDLPAVTGRIVIATDPPYGKNLYEHDKEQLTPVDLRHWVETFGRVSVFGWPEALVTMCIAARCRPTEWVTWWPTNGAMKGSSTKGLWQESECICVFGTQHLNELRRPRSKFGNWLANDWSEHEKRGGNSRGRVKTGEVARAGDVWTEASPHLGFTAAKRRHANEKPLTTMRRLIAGVARPGDVVIDPFAGSGTTLVAAKLEGCETIGVEIDKKHCETTRQRLTAEPDRMLL